MILSFCDCSDYTGSLLGDVKGKRTDFVFFFGIRLKNGKNKGRKSKIWTERKIRAGAVGGSFIHRKMGGCLKLNGSKATQRRCVIGL